MDQLSFQEKHNISKLVQVYFLISCQTPFARHLNILFQSGESNFLLMCFLIAIAARKNTDEMVYEYYCGFLTEVS